MKKLIVLVVVAAACGSHPSIDEYYKEQLQINCAFEVKCCASVSGDVVYTSEAACEAANDNSADLASVKTRIAAGTVAYDSGAAGSCIDQYRSIYSSCSAQITPSEETKILADCVNAVQGTGKAGATCDLSGENVGGSCDNATVCVPTGTSTTGTCTAVSKAGASCGMTGECVDGYYCDDTTSVCLKLKSDGATCEDESECESGSCQDAACANVSVPVIEFCIPQESD